MVAAGIGKQAVAQDDINIGMAEEMVYNEDFTSAIDMYNKLIAMDPNNGTYRFQLGFCYLNTATKKQYASSCFSKALELYKPKQRKGTQGIETEFYLGRAYRVNDSIDEALDVLEKLKKRVTNRRFLEIVDNEIEMCNLTKEMKSHPVEIEVHNLGAIVNGEYADHSPVITADESLLLFTSRREYEGGEKQADGQYDENIYYCYKMETGTWSEPIPIDSVNTPEHDATVALSYDGRELYIYREDNNGTLLVSSYDGSNWTKPKELNSAINTKYRETGAGISADGSKLYFASDRPGGKGGYDIYVAERQSNGDWGNVKNLGDKVNTKEDEEGPFIVPDNSRLYFSSKGHKGLGGYDIFHSDNQTNSWSDAVNAGFPINTAEDDVFLFLTPSGKFSYFASERLDGMGHSDLYVMGLPADMETKLTVMTGKVIVCEGDLPESLVMIRDNSLGIINTAIPNKRTGKFIFIVKRAHNYTLSVSVGDKIVFEETFDIPVNAPGQQLYKSVRLDPEKQCIEPVNSVALNSDDYINPKYIDERGVIYDDLIEVESILFNFAQANDDEISGNENFVKLSEYLKKNPTAVIEIGAFADSKGSAAFNQALTEKRANVAYDFLVNKLGVNPKQLKAVGYGEENPITFNKINGNWEEESKKYNRRIEFHILEEGEESLLIRQLKEKIPGKYLNPAYKTDYKKAAGTPETNI